jgi:hypothetical protein
MAAVAKESGWDPFYIARSTVERWLKALLARRQNGALESEALHLATVLLCGFACCPRDSREAPVRTEPRPIQANTAQATSSLSRFGGEPQWPDFICIVQVDVSPDIVALGESI